MSLWIRLANDNFSRYEPRRRKPSHKSWADPRHQAAVRYRFATRGPFSFHGVPFDLAEQAADEEFKAAVKIAFQAAVTWVIETMISEGPADFKCPDDPFGMSV